MPKQIPNWLANAKSEAQRLQRETDVLFDRILRESEARKLLTIAHHEEYQAFLLLCVPLEIAQRKWATEAKRWEGMTPDEQYEELKCEHPEEAQEVRTDVYVGESQVTQQDITTTAIVCGLCDQILADAPEGESYVSESN